ncbi:XisI protein [Planktothricoides sp. SR001]|uniref:XisI protein n=1 Tax=Planktothricoides sp. SR001 TaxID=1705388 RepID=UPI0012E30AA7|nr:XisI protein [Planktothricoides sp. SR001]
MVNINPDTGILKFRLSAFAKRPGGNREQDHYQLLNVGWHGNRRVRGCVLQIDIKNEKIWIQHDGTEIGVANELVEWGVPKEDIILAYHAPYKRPYTGFGVE